jgi:hypothetical protein
MDEVLEPDMKQNRSQNKSEPFFHVLSLIF